MPETNTGAGRLVPASALDFSRYAKNLAWLLEAPLHSAQELLAACYGFGSVHELRAAIPASGETEKPTGPFDAPRVRPPYFSTHKPYSPDGDNHLCPLSPRERKLLRFSMNALYNREDKAGRLRRRHYAVLDAGFFSVPSVHRKKFAEVKAGILAMEGTFSEREAYLQLNWPPAFWSYLEGTHLLHLDAAPGLSELKNSSTYFNENHVMSIANLFQDTAAHHAPAIFLEMAGEGTELSDADLPSSEELYDDWASLPWICNDQAGLFDLHDDDYWWHVLSKYLPKDSKELADTLSNMTQQEVAIAPPAGTPARVVELARKWRLHQLRLLSKEYLDSSHPARRLGRSSELFWPGSTGNNTVTTISEFAFSISRNGPYLMLYSELVEQNSFENEEHPRRLWRFKTLLTRAAAAEEEDVVGYMTGWLVVLTTDHVVSDEGELLAEAADIDRMLADGIRAFLKGYLSINGFDDLLEFANSRWYDSVAITEIVLRDKYKKQGLSELAFSGLTEMHQDAPFTDFPEGWRECADFEMETGVDSTGEEPYIEITPPGVFMVPVQRKNKRLRNYLMGLAPEVSMSIDEESLDVFPFHPEGSAKDREA